MLATLVMVGCNNPSASVKDEQQTVTYTDDYGTTVDIPLHPSRIVSTSPAVTEIIYALGGSHLLVGRTDFCSYPPEVADVESIGGISNLNIEKIMFQKVILITKMMDLDQFVIILTQLLVL